MKENQKITKEEYLEAKKVVEAYEQNMMNNLKDKRYKIILNDGIPYTTIIKFFSDYEISRILEDNPINFLGNVANKELIVYRPHFEKYFFEVDDDDDERDSTFNFKITE